MIERSAFDTVEGAMGQHKLTRESMTRIHGVVMNFVLEEAAAGRAGSAGSAGSYVVERDYARIVATSDVHADLWKFVQMLLLAKLVRSMSSSDDIYELVWTLEWAAKDTLLVITGDLVDGKRETGTVTDPHGSYEMLLHILLFNLRIGARKRNSDLMFNITFIR